MAYDLVVSGKKGGKKGGGSTRVAIEDPNTLRSKAVARVIDVVSDGEIVGLVNGLESVFFDDTPLANPDGSTNFSGVTVDERTGTPTQSHIAGFPSVESEVVVSTEVKFATEVVRTITGSNIDAVRVKLRIPQLTDQNTTNGDLRGSSVTIAIDVKQDGGSYVEMVKDTITGKCVAAYERAYRIELPEAGAPWDIRMRRITADSEKVSVQNQTWFASYTELIDVKLTYPDTALYAVAVDAELFGDNIPQRGYEVKGIILQVPTNYDPDTRVYDGIWDGTFKLAWSDNPAWVLYDLLTSKRYGLGDSISASQVDKWGLYTIAQYCDELVPDGFGGTEPRFTFNGVINTRQEAYDVLASVASAFRGMTYWASGAITAVQDAPGDPAKLVSPANVVDGLISYQGAGLKARHNVALVTWNNPANGYKADIEVVEDSESIALYGWRQIDVVAYGCTSKGQAHRFGSWILDSEKNETETCTYKAAFDHADVRPGQIIDLADPSYAGVRYGGRLVSATVSQVTLDATVTLQVGESYSLAVVLEDGTIATSSVTNSPGATSVLNLSPDLSAAPVGNAMWVLTGTDAAPRKFRVIGVKETEKGEFEVTSLFHDFSKYSRIEQNLVLEIPSYSAIPTGIIKKPTGLRISEYLYKATASVQAAIAISWEVSQDSRVFTYEVEILPPGESSYIPVGKTQTNTISVTNIGYGAHGIRVRGVTHLGQKSAWLEQSFDLAGLLDEPDDVTGFVINASDGVVYLAWDPVADLDLSHYVIKFTTDQAGASWRNSVLLFPHIPAGTNTVATQAIAGTYLIKAVDLSNIESVNATVLQNSVGSVTNMNVVGTITESAYGFLGVKDNTTVVGGFLQLGSAGTMSDWTTLASVETLTSGYVATGDYFFDDYFDLSEVYTSRVSISMDLGSDNLAYTMDTWASLSSVYGLDGTEDSDFSVDLYIRCTDDDPSGTPTWTAWRQFVIGDYTCRAFEFYAQLATNVPSVTPVVELLTVNIDMPDRVASEIGKSCPVNGTAITFSPAFKEKPVVGITAESMAEGDRFALTGISRTGFTVEFFNGATSIAKTFDYLAKGYGRVN